MRIKKAETPPNGRQPIYAGAAGKLAQAIDGTLGIFAPRLVHEWRKARVRSSALVAYEAARITRTNPRESTSSADAEVLGSLPQLRAASRALVRDDPHAATVMAIHEETIVGEGIRHQACCTPEQTGLTKEECDTWNSSCDEVFQEWADHDADSTDVGTFWDLQALFLRTSLTDGDGLAHAVIEGDRMHIELIDADRLESPGLRDTDTIRGGVEIDARGRRVAFHVLDRHPNDWLLGKQGVTKRLPARDGEYSLVQHFYRRTRAGQTRGVPLLTPAILTAKQLHHYLDSEMIAARAASNFALFIERTPTSADADIMPVQDTESATGQEFHELLEPGTIQYLNEGEKPHNFNPNRPGTSFDPFVTRLLRAISSSSGLAYEVVCRDFGRMNLSSARALLREIRRGFDLTRRRLVRAFCVPWYSNVIRQAVATGRLRPPAAWLDNQRPFLACRWVSPTFGMVDPISDTEAAVARVAANLSDPFEEAAGMGRDAIEVLRARAQFEADRLRIEEEFGLAPGTLNTGAPVFKQTSEPAPAQSDTPPTEDPNTSP